ncbi:hypothetical protein RCL1_004777 [Eukaryota sp. TZLM3-RCL]
MSETFETLRSNYTDVRQSMSEHSQGRNVTLVAVSKTKPSSLMQILYDLGHRDFGENYAQEIVQKYQELPSDITYHFIGPIQSNKVKSLARIPNIILHTIDREKIANLFNIEGESQGRVFSVFVQVNICDEDTKSGVTETEALGLCRFIVDNCPYLNLIGLMTIGSPGDLTVFPRMKQLTESISLELKKDLQISMGMSDDFCEAIDHGSNFVRVGSLLFGKRNYT